MSSAIWGINGYSISCESGQLFGSLFAIFWPAPICVLWGIGWTLAGLIRSRTRHAKVTADTDSVVGRKCIDRLPKPCLPHPQRRSRTLLGLNSELGAVDCRRANGQPVGSLPALWTIAVGVGIGRQNAKFGWSPSGRQKQRKLTTAGIDHPEAGPIPGREQRIRANVTSG